MDFTQDLLAFQGAIISANNVHSFASITARGGNEFKILDIVGILYKFLQDKQFVTQDGVTDEGQSQMRKFCFYLILNSDIRILADLIEMPGVDSVVWTVPTINKHLICDLIWGLNMDMFLTEIITFCNPPLALDVLTQFTDHIKHCSPTESVMNQIKLLAACCYRLICRLHFYKETLTTTYLSDITENFLIITTYYEHPPKPSKLCQLSKDEIYKHQGHNFNSLLTLTLQCLDYFTSIEKFDADGFDAIYHCTIKPHDLKTETIAHRLCDSEDELLLDSLYNCNTVLFDKCKTLVMNTSVKIYCAWSEFEENGKTMQKTIGELCHSLHSCAGKIPSLQDHPLITMLPQLSSKPVDIHDVINFADNCTILENANKNTAEQVLWLEAIIKKDDLRENIPFIECLLSNINYINEDNCEKLFKMSQNFLKESEPTHSSVIKMLAIKSFEKLNDIKKTEIISEHFPERVMHNSLQTEDFHNVNIELFNKLISSPVSNLSDVYTVFIQNPLEVYMKIISSAIDNSKQSELMLKIMKMLQPYACHFYITDTDPTIIKAIVNISKNNLETDIQLCNFVSFISDLKKSDIFSGAKLLLLVIMPGLHRALVDRNFRMLNVEVKLLKSAYDVNELVEYRAPVLAMISQILEATRWSFTTFEIEAPDTLEGALDLQMKLFNTYQGAIPGNEAIWLKSKLNHLKALNMYYYKELWSPPGDNFLNIISGEETLNTDKLTLLLTKILYSLTPSEWILTWNCLKGYGDVIALQTVYNSLLLMIAAMDSDRNVNTMSCLLYCYRNFIMIVKNNFFKEPLLDSYVENVIDKVITLANKHKEEDIEDISLVLLPLLSYIADRKSDYTVNVSCIGNKIRHPSFAVMVNQLFFDNME